MNNVKIKLLIDLFDAWNTIIYHKGEIVDSDVDIGDNGVYNKKMYCIGGCFYVWEHNVEEI